MADARIRGRRIALLAVLLAPLTLAAQVPAGSLEIHSEPGAVLQWEGTFLGTTNGEGMLEVSDIPPGDYSLQLTKRGFSPTAAQIEIRSGERTVFELPLEVEPGDSEERDEPSTGVSAATPTTQRQLVSPPYLLIAGLAAVALIALVLYRRRDRLEIPALEPAMALRPKVQRISRPDSSSGFLNDLKTRERDLDRFVSERRSEPRKPLEVIDVEVAEVMEATEVTETSGPEEAL